MSRWDLRRRHCLAVGALLVMAFAPGIRNQVASPRRHPPEERSEERRQARERAEWLCTTLLPDQRGLQTAASLHIVYGRDGEPRRIWVVECANERQRGIARVTWNTATNSLAMFINQAELMRPARQNAVSRQEMLALSWNGLRALQRDEDVTMWRLAEAMRKEEDTWCARLRSAGHRVMFVADMRTGVLVQVAIVPEAEGGVPGIVSAAP